MTNAITQLVSNLRALFAQFTQSTRLLRLHTPFGANELLAETVSGYESLDRGGYCFDVTALSTNAHLSVNELIGQPVLIELLTDSTDLRPIHGHITLCEQTAANGGFARYILKIEPWLSFLRNRRDSYLFQEKSVLDIAEEIFGDYAHLGPLAPAWRIDVRNRSDYPPISIVTQHNETDYDFLTRLFVQEGLFYWFEHESNWQSETLGTHILVIADHNGAFTERASTPLLISRADATEARDTLQSWTTTTQRVPHTVKLTSWDYRRAAVLEAEASIDPLPPLADLFGTVRDTPGAYAFRSPEDADRYAHHELESLRVRGTVHHAMGTVRNLRLGQSFQVSTPRGFLSEPDAYARYVPLELWHYAQNNLDAQFTQGLNRLLETAASTSGHSLISHAFSSTSTNSAQETSGTQDTATAAAVSASPIYTDSHLQALRAILQASLDQEPRKDPTSTGTSVLYRNALVAINVATAYRTAAKDLNGRILHPRPTAEGNVTAVVVGTDDAPITTDRDTRIKVQFHWQRGQRSHNRLAHTQDTSNNAPANAQLGAWVRVMTPTAGSNFGLVNTPRVGQEVVIGFLDQDVDRPVVLGTVYNGQGEMDAASNRIQSGAGTATGNAPAWFAGEKDTHAHPAVLTGFKTQALAASATGTGGYNQLVFDATQGQSRVQLATTQATSAFSLGHLTAQNDNARNAARGFGAELMTEEAGALRAGKGMLFAAHQRNDQSMQLDVKESTAQLKASQELSQALAKAAQTHQASSRQEGQPGQAKQNDLSALTQLKQNRESLQAQAGRNALSVSKASSATTSQVTSSSNNVSSASDSAASQSANSNVTAFESPLIAFSAPAGIAVTTPKHAWLSAGQTLSVLSHQHVNLAAQGAFGIQAKDGIRLFTQGNAASSNSTVTETGIALHAASGNVAVESQSAVLKMVANNNVAITSTTQKIDVQAKEQVQVIGGGSYIRIEGDNIEIGSPGQVWLKGTKKNLIDAASFAVESLTFPAVFPVSPSDLISSQRLNLAHVIGLQPNETSILEKAPYEVRNQAGALVSHGTLNDQGLTEKIFTKQNDKLTLWVGEGDWKMLGDIEH